MQENEGFSTKLFNESRKQDELLDELINMKDEFKVKINENDMLISKIGDQNLDIANLQVIVTDKEMENMQRKQIVEDQQNIKSV